MAYEYMMDYGTGEETEEERRKREEREAAERAAALAPDNIDVGGGFNPAAGGEGGGFMDALGTYAQRRFDRAVEPFTNPTAALNRRMGMTPEEAANTEVQTQTVKTYGDGSQEEITKRQIPAAGAAPTAAAPVNPAEMGAAPQPTAQPQQAQRSPEEIAKNAQALREMAQGRAAQAAPVPQQLPAQGAITPEQAATPVAPVELPKFGPPVQVAGGPPGTGVAEAAAAAQQARPVAPTPTTPTGQPQVGAPQTAPSLAQAGAQAQAAPAPAPAAAPAQPVWLDEANAAGSDFNKLLDVAAKYPEARGSIQLKLQGIVENQRKAQEAEKIVQDAQAGDPKAINKLEQSLRPTKGKEREEVTVGDYLKAYMYARLGLNDLSQEVQAKISGKDTEFGQVQLGNTTWSVERNRKTGEIIRAKDDEGTVATQNTLNKIAAAGQKFGTQAFSSTGGSQVIPAGQPNAGEEYRTVFNSTTGQFENKIITGKNAGEKYIGPAGIDKSVFTQGAKMDYGVISKYREKFGTDKLAALDQARKDGAIKTPADEAVFLDRWNFMSGVPGYGGPGAPTVAPSSSVPGTTPQATTTPVTKPAVAAAPVRPGVMGDRTTVAPTVSPFANLPTPTPAAQATAGGGIPERGVNESETAFNSRKAEWAKRQELERQIEEEKRKTIQKPAAEQIAVSADTQNMLNSISKVVKTLDSGKHNIGSAAAVVVGRGPVAQAIGEQFETKDAKNTKLILDTVNKLAAEGLKVLGSNPSGPDLKFWTENKPNGSTDPDVMKEWVESRAADIKRRLNYAEKQVGAGGRAGTAPPVYPEKTIDGVTYYYDGQGWKKK